jgi:sugar lactone lactonase YvrE
VLKVIARGGTIHGANGMMFDDNDNLHIASVAGREIVVMEPETGRVIDRLGVDSGVESPDDVAFGPDGSLYWTSFFTGEVGRLSPEGVKTGQFVAPGVNPITFSDDGRLFVALDFLGDGLYEIDPELADPPRPIIASKPANPFPLGFLNGFDFGPDGRLYGPIWLLGMVVSLDVDSCNPIPTDSPWTDCDIRVVPAGFDAPAAAKFDSQGNLHVVDQSGDLFQVDTDTGDTTLIVTLQPGLDNLAFDSNDRLFVANADHSSVAQVLPSGTPRFISKGGMVLPGGVAVLPRQDGGESVVVADVFSLREFNGLTGRPLGVVESVLGLSELTSPFTVSADGEYLVISSWFAGEVQIWDPGNRRVVANYPMPVPLNAIRFQNDLVVADLGFGGVVWASTGSLILGAPDVFVPTGLAASGNVLWVADWAIGIVWQLTFDDDGNLVDQTLIAADLNLPEGLALDLDGSLLVVETGSGRLSRIDRATGAATVVADGLQLGAPGFPGGVPTQMFNGVAVGPSGAIYITGDIANVIYRIWPRR